MGEAASEPVRLHVARLVEGAAGHMPLVLLHGFTGDSTTWGRLLPHLGRRRPVLGVDIVGHGRSDAPADPGAYAMPAAVAGVLRAVAGAGVDGAHWMGYSMGGRLALSLALAAPEHVSSIVLVGASPGLADAGERAARVRADEDLAVRLEGGGIDAFVERWMAHPLFATQARLGADYLMAARDQRRRNRPAALARSLRGMGTGAMPSVGARLGEVRAPALLVAGAEDPKFAGLARAMAARMPHAETWIAPAAGHAVHVEAPAALGMAVRQFLERAEAG